MPLLRPLLIGLILTFLGSAAAQESDPQALLEQILDNLRGETQVATLTMAVIRPGEENAYTLRIFGEGDERALTRVIAPPRDAGQAFLSQGDNLFIYNPRLRRVLRLPPSGQSDSFLGSDISYNDLAGDDLRQFYTPSVLSQDAVSVTLELTPTANAPTPYGKLELRAEKPTLAPTRIVYYDQRGSAVKENLLSNYAEVEGRAIPQRFEVRDLLEEGSHTVLVWEDAEFGVTIPEACFSERALERTGVCE
jgi:outer membrane lipoprotein-sorting protein